MLASVAEQYMIAKSFENPMTMDENIRFFSNFSTKPHILYEGAIFLRKFNIKN